MSPSTKTEHASTRQSSGNRACVTAGSFSGGLAVVDVWAMRFLQVKEATVWVVISWVKRKGMELPSGFLFCPHDPDTRTNTFDLSVHNGLRLSKARTTKGCSSSWFEVDEEDRDTPNED